MAGRPVNRIEPKLPPGAFQTFQVLAPARSHFRRATCAEVVCEFHLSGWRLRVEGLTPEDVHAATHSGRRYRELRVAQGETWLVFEPGQDCFRSSQHKIRLDRPEIYAVSGGDHRAFTGSRQIFSGPDAWVDSFGEHQAKINRAING